MSENTKIEWATHTFNPWEGCQKVSPGCDNCYAENRNARFGGGTAINWGPGAPRRRTSVQNWRKPLAWNAAHAEFFVQHGCRQRVFCASLADVFDNAVLPLWRIDLFDLIGRTPNLDWLLLTKRIGNITRILDDYFPGGLASWADRYQNVWMGATIVNQEEADRDIPKLLAVPATKRFLSMEPLLGPVSIEKYLDRIDWVIVGGESGPNARPMHPQWARDLRDQCAAADVPFLFKQWGEYHPSTEHDNVANKCHDTPEAIHVSGEREYRPFEQFRLTCEPDNGWTAMCCVGKKAAGRLLDGITHNGYPA